MTRGRHTEVFIDPGTTRIVDSFEGEGPLYVLIAGLGAKGEIFSLVAKALRARGKSYLTIDPLGFGYRQPADCCTTLGEAADAVVASGILEGQPAIFVGHSAGGMEAIELEQRSSNVLGLVLVNAILDDISGIIDKPIVHAWRHPVKAYLMAIMVNYLIGWLPKSFLRRLERPRHPFTWLFWPLVARPWKLSAEALTHLVRDNRCPGAWRHLLANRHYDLAAQAPQIRTKVLAIWGKWDPLGTHPGRSRFIAGCAQVTTVELHTGHHSPLEAPDEVADALIEFARVVSA